MLSLTRGRVCHLPESQSAVVSLLSVCTICILHVIKRMYICMYIQYIPGLCQSRLSTADHAHTASAGLGSSLCSLGDDPTENTPVSIVTVLSCESFFRGNVFTEQLPSNTCLFSRSLYSNCTTRYNTLHNRRYENIKSHITKSLISLPGCISDLRSMLQNIQRILSHN
jgi:hypothetical protein